MLSNGKAVVRGVLFRFHAAVKLRQKLFRDSCFICHTEIIRMRRDKKLHKLCLNPLGTDISEILSQSADPRLRLFLDLKTKLCRKTHCPHDTQCILMKALQRITYTTDDLVLHIIHPVKKIDNPLLRMVCHGIDREISAFQILFQTGSKRHLLRMTAIFIFTVHTVSCHLITFLIHHYRDSTVLEPGIYRAWK